MKNILNSLHNPDLCSEKEEKEAVTPVTIRGFGFVVLSGNHSVFSPFFVLAKIFFISPKDCILLEKGM
jgi:hypothetical protein